MACKDCTTGVLHGGTPQGTVGTLHGLPCYTAEPPAGTQPKAIVVIIPDAFGWELVNNRILADSYASKGGFRVHLPDFMKGWAAPADMLESMENAMSKEASIFSRIPSLLRTAIWFTPFMLVNRPGAAKPRILPFLQALRAATSLPVGAAGFCWGGKFVTQLCAGADTTRDGARPLIDAGYTAHPSLLELPGDVARVALPYSVAIGDHDMAMPMDKVRVAQDALKGKEGWTEFVVYEGAKHGFAVRGDPRDEKVLRQGIEAEDQAVRWFTKYLVEKQGG